MKKFSTRFKNCTQFLIEMTIWLNAWKNSMFAKSLKRLQIKMMECDKNIIDTWSIASIIVSIFSLIAKCKIKTFSKELFLTIIANDHLKIENEDWLFNIINEYFEDEEKEDDQVSGFSDIMIFYEEVKMCNLSDSKFKK